MKTDENRWKTNENRWKSNENHRKRMKITEACTRALDTHAPTHAAICASPLLAATWGYWGCWGDPLQTRTLTSHLVHIRPPWTLCTSCPETLCTGPCALGLAGGPCALKARRTLCTKKKPQGPPVVGVLAHCHMHTFAYACMPACTHARMHARTHARMHTCNAYVRMHTYAYAYACICICICMHLHAYAPARIGHWA